MLRSLFQCSRTHLRLPPNRNPLHSRDNVRRIHTSHTHRQDYYGVLGVKKDATQREIKSAYYQLSKKYHPDVAGKDATAAAKFIDVSEAYECLKDPQKRRAYDNGMYGGGGRYTGDYSDPFQNYQSAFRQSYQRQGGNPFHNRQFTQAEYERVWNQFNRMRNERESYDQRVEFERQRLWMEFARRRAERWKAFHEKYPNGPPGSIKWEFRWGGPDSRSQRMDFGWGSEQARRQYQGWELVRRIAVVYFVCFLIVSFVQVFFQALSPKPAPRRDSAPEEPLDKDKIEAMINRRPSSPTEYMYKQPEGPGELGPVPSEPSAFFQGKEVTYSDGNGSEFSRYVSS